MVCTRTNFNTKIPGMLGYNSKTSTFRPNVTQEQKKWGWITKG